MSRSDPNIYTIKDMDEEERPRERLARLGPQSLTTAELLAILLRVGTVGETSVQVGQRLLQTFSGIAGIHRASFEELSNQRGIKLAKAAQIKAAI
jgi:DNA repair protein RadC